MSEPIKILHVVGRMDRGGTETLLMNLLNSVNRKKYQFDFVEQTQDECGYDKEILSLGSKIYRAPQISAKSLGEYRNWWSQFYKEHPEYQIIHGHSRGSAPVYLDEAKKAGRITILHCHSNSHGKGLNGFIRYIWQIQLRKCAEYNFACSFGAGISQFGQNGKFKVIKNGIHINHYKWDVDIRETVKQELGLHDDDFVIGNVSRFEIPKNHTFLLQIFHEILCICPKARLVLVGQGSLEENIRKQAKELGLVNKIIFTGVRSDVNRLLQAMDVFVFPSLYEGLPVSLVEAQAAGLPCFVSDKVISNEVDLTELMHHIPLESSPKEWAKQIVDGRISLENRRDTSKDIIAAGFDIKSTADMLCDFYEGVINEKQ